MGVTVLLVDDHEAFRRRARAMLEADGFTVVGEAADAASAIAAVRRLRPQVVLLDVRLPDRSGFDVADEIAIGDAPPAVVLISSREARDYGSRIATTASCGFIAKHELAPTQLRILLEAEMP